MQKKEKAEKKDSDLRQHSMIFVEFKDVKNDQKTIYSIGLYIVIYSYIQLYINALSYTLRKGLSCSDLQIRIISIDMEVDLLCL